MSLQTWTGKKMMRNAEDAEEEEDDEEDEDEEDDILAASPPSPPVAAVPSHHRFPGTRATPSGPLYDRRGDCVEDTQAMAWREKTTRRTTPNAAQIRMSFTCAPRVGTGRLEGILA